MSKEKRPRRRPRGSGKNDAPWMAQVADLPFGVPSLKPSTAMKQVMTRQRHNWTETDETLLRRWQVKWKEQGEVLMAAARERARPRPAVPLRDLMASMSATGEIKHSAAFIEMQNSLKALTASPALIEAMKAIQVLPPACKEINEVVKAFRMPPDWQDAIRTMRDSLVSKQISEVMSALGNSATRKLFDELNFRLVPSIYNF